MSLLTSGWLRRTAPPLRAAYPELCAQLNQFRKRDFCHLLPQPDELRVAPPGRVDTRLEQPIIDGAYSDIGIHRLFHHDYLREFEHLAATDRAFGCGA